MYKKILRNIRKAENTLSLYKTEESVLKKPHVIFSAENPLYPENLKYKMSHKDVVDFLRRKGYHTQEIDGHYGKPEKSIFVSNPSKTAVKHLLDLSRDLGQESSIYSNGYDHEMHYHGGEHAGKHNKGQGTTFHKTTPKENYSTLPNGSQFTHIFNFDETHESKDSMIKKNDSLKKSESSSGAKIPQNDKHPLELAGPDTKLIHYSPTPDLTHIDPAHQGVRRIGSETKQGRPENPMAFFYLEGTKPEHIVTSGAQHKYVSHLGNRKVYDIGVDPDNIKAGLKQASMNRQINQGSYTKDELDDAIKQKGYHGIYNSSLGDTMKNVVGLYHPMPVKQAMPIHPKDFEEATATDHHGDQAKLKSARQFAKDNGHHDGTFLHKLAQKLGEDNG